MRYRNAKVPTNIDNYSTYGVVSWCSVILPLYMRSAVCLGFDSHPGRFFVWLSVCKSLATRIEHLDRIASSFLNTFIYILSLGQFLFCLSSLIAISKVSKEFNYVRPTLTSEKIISIKQGKHPLYMLTCDNFVSNDVESSQEAGFVKILTGPNSSGKSVYMKQIGEP